MSTIDTTIVADDHASTLSIPLTSAGRVPTAGPHKEWVAKIREQLEADPEPDDAEKGRLLLLLAQCEQHAGWEDRAVGTFEQADIYINRDARRDVVLRRAEFYLEVDTIDRAAADFGWLSGLPNKSHLAHLQARVGRVRCAIAFGDSERAATEREFLHAAMDKGEPVDGIVAESKLLRALLDSRGEERIYRDAIDFAFDRGQHDVYFRAVEALHRYSGDKVSDELQSAHHLALGLGYRNAAERLTICGMRCSTDIEAEGWMGRSHDFSWANRIRLLARIHRQCRPDWGTKSDTRYRLDSGSYGPRHVVDSLKRAAQ